jgi:hypothetical protein
MTAYIGLHHGLLQGGIFGVIALLVIAVGLITYRSWVARSENRHIERGGAVDIRADGDTSTPGGRTSGGGA